jgi:hypothetical protein
VSRGGKTTSTKGRRDKGNKPEIQLMIEAIRNGGRIYTLDDLSGSYSLLPISA